MEYGKMSEGNLIHHRLAVILSGHIFDHYRLSPPIGQGKITKEVEAAAHWFVFAHTKNNKHWEVL